MTSPAENREAHGALVAQLREKLAAAALGGPERARARHVDRGKLLPRDRVDGLLMWMASLCVLHARMGL